MHNQLIHETSPYLLQHAHNPVNWYPWGEAALELARSRNLPILVSIGYSACHWCHVMERESFENDAVAAFMNRCFVCIKIDREERPDIDQIYMDAVTALTGHGGWPLNCFLLPDGRPFYGGTYFPPDDRYQRPSWMSVLQGVWRAFSENRAVVEQQANRLTAIIAQQSQQFFEPLISPNTLSSAHIEAIAQRLGAVCDREHGGFGTGQKFPQTFSLRFLLAYHYYQPQESWALEQVTLSIDQMLHGGLYDHVGGGFARYTVDREWCVPHFEKMLYDNALLVILLSEAYQVTQRSYYRRGIEETLQWLLRDLQSPEGGFYCAYDADSEGEEGKFYTWQKTEIEQLLQHEARVFNLVFGVTEAGNWENTNILQRHKDLDSLAKKIGYEPDELERLLQRSLRHLFRHREQRPKPLLDNKILLSWNALAVSAFCHAFIALGVEAYRQTVVDSLAFLRQKFSFSPDSYQLFHTYQQGKGKYHALLDDYACLISAYIDAYSITFDENYLCEAGGFLDYCQVHFLEEGQYLYNYVPHYQTEVVVRQKDSFDGATPSGNSTMADNLWRLGILLDRRDYPEQSLQMTDSLSKSLEKYASSFGQWARVRLQQTYPSVEVGIVGNGYAVLARECCAVYHPNRLVCAAMEASALPLLKGKVAATLGEALCYVCHSQSCFAPVRTAAEAIRFFNG
ncbi:MAG TPA: thioredoxin domain-containing protein [Chitinophagales bacterium]|nr:thioredoxin domain-containing protein [Chitinophagales bacterium]